MIRIDWTQLCETAFLDSCDRLCMIGIMTRFPAPELPIAMRQLMIVVRIAGLQAQESFCVGVSMVTPCGATLSPQHRDGVDISVTNEYVFLTLRDIPFAEEGIHRSNVTVGKGDPVPIDVPVLLSAGGNTRHNDAAAFAQASWAPGSGANLELNVTPLASACCE